jgi:hypothetical protein
MRLANLAACNQAVSCRMLVLMNRSAGAAYGASYISWGFGGFNILLNFRSYWTIMNLDWRAVTYRGGVQTPLKFRSFDKAGPNSQFRGKYIRNNLIRIRVSLICKLSGTPDQGLPPIELRSVCPLSVLS